MVPNLSVHSHTLIVMKFICHSQLNWSHKAIVILIRVLEIMLRDSNKDPATEPNAVHARLLVGQVSVVFPLKSFLPRF